MISKLVKVLSKRARLGRAEFFRNTFDLNENTKILDLGSETGANIHSVLAGTDVRPENVFIADINADSVQHGAKAYGFVPVLIDESGAINYDNSFFDIVYCSSVIEHVTVDKDRVWKMKSAAEFSTVSLARQKEFADEVRRLGKQYFVQTPSRSFPIESHSWLPFIGWFPRRLLIPVLRLTNQVWIKKTQPDWHLLNKKSFSAFFPEADIVDEKVLFMTKSIMAIQSEKIQKQT